MRDSLQKFLEERIFNPKRDCVLQKQFFGIWMRINDDESLWLICYPIKREKYKTPPPAVELFIPFDAAEISAPKISEVVQTDEEHCKIEVENHKLVAELPLSELYISPAPLVHLGSPCLLKKESGFINLQKTLENDPLSLEPLDRVNICLSVISAVEVLEKGGFVAPCLDPSAIMFQKGGKAKLDSLFHLRALSSENRNQLHESLDTKRLDLLAREKKNVSLDTGRYGLILLICELFFLSIQEIPRIKNMFDWGEEFLGRFKSVASPELYKEVYSLREKCGSLNKCFSEGVLALYNLRKNKKNKEDKKDPEKEALGQLASLVLFPVLPGLLLETLSIEGIRREKLDQGCFLEEILLIEPMPSLKDIRKVLEEGKSELVSLLDGIN